MADTKLSTTRVSGDLSANGDSQTEAKGLTVTTESSIEKDGKSFLNRFRPEPVELEAKAPGDDSVKDAATRVAMDRADAADYVEKMLEAHKITLVNLAAVYTPIFNPELMRETGFFEAIKKIEADTAFFKKTILGKSATKG